MCAWMWLIQLVVRVPLLGIVFRKICRLFNGLKYLWWQQYILRVHFGNILFWNLDNCFLLAKRLNIKSTYLNLWDLSFWSYWHKFNRISLVGNISNHGVLIFLCFECSFFFFFVKQNDLAFVFGIGAIFFVVFILKPFCCVFIVLE